MDNGGIIFAVCAVGYLAYLVGFARGNSRVTTRKVLGAKESGFVAGVNCRQFDREKVQAVADHYGESQN